MAEEPRSTEAAGKRPKKRTRPVRKSGGGVIQTVVGLLLALVIFGVIYVVMQRSGMGDREYLSDYAKVTPGIIKSDFMDKDEIWNKIHALPINKVTDPTIRELHQAWIEYATVIRDPDDFTKRGAEIEERIKQLEFQVGQKFGVIVEKAP